MMLLTNRSHRSQTANRGAERTFLSVICRYSGGGRGGGRKGGGFKPREYKVSDGVQHLGSSLNDMSKRPFPGPPPDSGSPLRILPIGGLGEIGMNCMLVGCYDRYIVIDAGLMFPDFQDLGMQKILPDTSFLHQWKDKIEALVITHGHEDHIGALPWVIPALDPSTPVYASSFVMRLIQRRLTEFSLFDEGRFKQFDMSKPFTAGPFEVEPVRVTHSIPDCCGLIMRSEHGTIVHTGDWKIDETPVDGLEFDRTTFEKLGRENVVLMMSDSTNVLSTGRTPSERIVEQSIVNKVLKHKGKGRVVVTQFASNLHRLHSVKQAADASGRKICFVGMSLNHYLEAAHKDGRAPIDPRDVLQPNEIEDYDPNKVLIVTTGSQAEPRAALSLASREASHQLKLMPNDLVLYSAKVIPGNETRVVRMLNSIAAQGATVVQGRSEDLHVSGHAYQDELTEVLRLVKPQHFLPVHGEYSFLCEHARLAKETAGIRNVSVIKNGTMLGVQQLRNAATVSTGSAAKVVGEVSLINFYNDGNKGTGTAQEMALTVGPLGATGCISTLTHQERTSLAFEGIVVVALDIYRSAGGGGASVDSGGGSLRCRCRLTTRGMWTDKGALLAELHRVAEGVVSRLSSDASLAVVERQVIDSVRKACKTYNQRTPEVIVIAHENDPRSAHIPLVAAGQQQRTLSSQQQEGRRAVSGSKPWERPYSSSRGPGVRKPDEVSEGEGNDSSGDERLPFSVAPERSAAEVQDTAAAAAGGVPSSNVKRKLLEARKAVVESRKAAAAAAGGAPTAQTSSGPQSGPPSEPLPEGVLERRKQLNPRDRPSKENDPDFG